MQRCELDKHAVFFRMRSPLFQEKRMGQLACIRRLGLAPEPSGGEQWRFFCGSGRVLAVTNRTTSRAWRRAHHLSFAGGQRRKIENLRLLRRMILGWSDAASECETSEIRW